MCLRVAHVPFALQYFSPYVSADMRKMATAFNTTVAALEDELTQLILEGLINARIDSHSKVGSLRAVGCGRETLGPTEPCTSTDPICPGRGSAQHHLREVPADGQGVPAPCQSHDRSSESFLGNQMPIIVDVILYRINALCNHYEPGDSTLLGKRGSQVSPATCPKMVICCSWRGQPGCNTTPICMARG